MAGKLHSDSTLGTLHYHPSFSDHIAFPTHNHRIMSTQPTEPSSIPSTVGTHGPTVTWSGNGTEPNLSELQSDFSSRLQDYKQRLESDRKAIEHTMNVSTSFSDKEAAQHLEAASLLKERESHITQMSGLNEELYSIVQSIASCPTGRAPPPDFFRQASANGNVLGYMAGVLLVREENAQERPKEKEPSSITKNYSRPLKIMTGRSRTTKKHTEAWSTVPTVPPIAPRVQWLPPCCRGYAPKRSKWELPSGKLLADLLPHSSILPIPP